MQLTLRGSPQSLALAALFFGLFMASLGLMAMRFAQQEGLATPVIIAIRLTMGMLVFAPVTLGRHSARLRGLPRRDWLLLLLAGALFSGDLLLFAESIRHASVLLASVIGSLIPLSTALLERLVLRRPLPRAVLVGVALALAGMLIIALGNPTRGDAGPRPLLGMLLSGGSMFCASGYLITARSLRMRIALLPYTWVVFSIAALFALGLTVLGGSDLRAGSMNGYAWALVATILSQLIAHPSFNYAIGTLSPTLISVASQSIIVFASMLALLFFQQIPGPTELLGSLVILGGVLYAIRARRPA